MPEMPEIQAHTERMSSALAGSTLAAFELLNFAALKTFSPAVDAAVGHRLLGMGRRAKYLLFEFSNGHTHVVHLMQGGRLRPDPKRSRKPRLGLARWVFTNAAGDEEAWLLTEAGTERKAGVWAVDGNPTEQDPLLGLGPEAIDLNLDQFTAVLGDQSKRIHGVLRDQRTLSGLGRMLANEICYEAGISPFANASKLSEEAIAQLHQAMLSIADASIAHERTLDDIGKSADRPSKVHNRAGDPCFGCDGTVRSVEYRRYTVFYCPTRQTGGKLLADNTTSKFLK